MSSALPLPAGAIAVIEVVEFTVKLAAGVEPNLTLATEEKFEPVTATEVPWVPRLGVTAVTVGATV